MFCVKHGMRVDKIRKCIFSGDKLAYVDSDQEKLVVCELHDGSEIECKASTKLRAFKPKSLVLDEYENIKVLF